MKQRIDYATEDLTEHEREFLKLWKLRKYQDDTTILTVGDCLELLIALEGQRHEVSVIDELLGGSYFNNVLVTEDLILAYEGDELLDILFYNVRKALRRRLSRSQFFPE